MISIYWCVTFYRFVMDVSLLISSDEDITIRKTLTMRYAWHGT